MRGTLKKKSAGNRAAAYIRVSDESQVQGYSLDAQRIEIARWCERNGYQLIPVYSDEGVSARTEMIEKRPQLVRLLDDARLKKFDIVVVHTLDRWARNIGVQRQAIRRLAEFEIGFTSATEDFDYSSPHGRLVLTMIGGAAEFFSDQLAVHVSKSQGLRAELGFPVGPVPFGYRTLEPGGIPQLYKEEPGAVCKIYERRAAGESYGSLADWLNDQGFKTIAGGFFTSHAVRDLLECRFYLGKITYRGEEYPGRHEAIVSEELYQRIQARKQKRDSIRSVQGPKGVLQGLIACGNCGKRIQSDRHRFGGAMYRERHSHQCETNNRSIMAKKVDEQIEAILTSVELRPEWRDEMAKLAIASVEGPTPKQLKDKRRRLSRAYAEGAFNDKEYEEKLAEIDVRLRLTENVELPTLEEAASLFEDIPQLWEEATPEERRKLISPIVERVYVDMESSMIGAIVPTTGFRRLLEGAMMTAENPAVILLSEDESDRLKVWSWWRRGRVELPVQKIP